MGNNLFVTVLVLSVKELVNPEGGSTSLIYWTCWFKHQCPHEHLSTQGGFHFSGGEVWDDIKEVCDDLRKGIDFAFVCNLFQERFPSFGRRSLCLSKGDQSWEIKLLFPTPVKPCWLNLQQGGVPGISIRMGLKASSR